MPKPETKVVNLGERNIEALRNQAARYEELYQEVNQKVDALSAQVAQLQGLVRDMQQQQVMLQVLATGSSGGPTT
jgi:prefoldin subunit 5